MDQTACLKNSKLMHGHCMIDIHFNRICMNFNVPSGYYDLWQKCLPDTTFNHLSSAHACSSISHGVDLTMNGNFVNGQFRYLHAKLPSK